MTDLSPDPNVEALADWFDRQKWSNVAEAIRDWHVERDGNWRGFALGLAAQIKYCRRWAGITATSAQRQHARYLLRQPKQNLRDLLVP